MESLSETPWDVVIEGTGLRQSLLALALSRSDKKILHVDKNEYYGGPDAAFSLQEAEDWVGSVARDSPTKPFTNAALWKASPESSNVGLSFSRAYSLSLSPQIIYTKSKLLAHLVSSKVYRQLEFQAVGNWWIYDVADSNSPATLKRLPNGREHIFEDKSIDNRAKRSLMKFLKFVIDYENHSETWEAHAETGFAEFLASQFQLPPHLQTVIVALTLTLDSADQTTVKFALPRVARHLTSIGVFGPGFGAVVPKWGGGAEIAQVACRAGAVGGGVYVLGTGITSLREDSDQARTEVGLSNGDTVTTKFVSRDADAGLVGNTAARKVSKIIAVVSSPLASLFESSVEGSPLAAVSVVVFPAQSIDSAHDHPIYIMVHSSETGECPAGQCVLYLTTLNSNNSSSLLSTALTKFLTTFSESEPKPTLLYKLSYDQRETHSPLDSTDELDLAFNDGMLQDVEREWKEIMGEEGESERFVFMQFEERNGEEGGDDDDEI